MVIMFHQIKYNKSFRLIAKRRRKLILLLKTKSLANKKEINNIIEYNTVTEMYTIHLTRFGGKSIEI